MMPDLAPVSPAFADTLKSQLPGACFRPLTPAYLEEPRNVLKGRADLLVAPGSVDEVATILRLCHQARIGVVPYGGGTGLVGGQVSDGTPAPLILSLERMRAIRVVDPGDNVIVAEAGAVLADVQAAAASAERLFPLSLASEGSCQIGGNLSTNAGGIGVLRYGSMRDLCLGIEAVLPDGTIWNGLSRLRKDNTGYDLKDLLIGAEGSLGIITAASLKLFARPRRHIAALCQISGPEAALALLATCRERLGGTVSAFELIHRQGFDFLAEKMPQLRLPFTDPTDWMVLIDLGIGGEQGIDEGFEALLVEAFDAGLVSDALVAQTDQQRRDFWAVRETIPEANRLVGAIYSHDISVPVSRIPEFIRHAGALIAGIGDLRVNCFGHVGDGNLHYNIFPPKGQDRAAFGHLKDDIRAAVYGLVYELGGSMSAEHGIGRLKRDDLRRFGHPAKLAAMRAIKAALDPHGIMNPGAVVPDP
ncbi:MAG: FAD-binding oxidoreductase [Rhodobacteraceae bacterium]|nr:FAD-binding oxidoreductase [Paracoccaceae bacterium]